MTDINPNNYDGTSVVLVGRAGGPVDTVTFSNGHSQAQLSIAVGKGYENRETGEWTATGTDWYTLTSTPEYAAENWPEVGSGDKVRVDDARLELKPYLRKNGEAGVDATLRYGTLVVVEKAKPKASVAPF